jgi:ABC-type nickel/cobalt efflux system permease component RcnA
MVHRFQVVREICSVAILVLTFVTTVDLLVVGLLKVVLVQMYLVVMS